MPGQLDICNQALSVVGTRSTIASLTEASNEAQQCSLHYDTILTGLLRLHRWSFARRQMSLALLCAASGTPENPSGTPPFPVQPWNYSYAYPNDCVRVRSVFNPYRAYPASQNGIPTINNLSTITNNSTFQIPFQIAVDKDSAGNTIKVILTNQQQAQLIYTMEVTDPNLWDSDFSDAMVYTLAARLCGPLTGNTNLIQVFLRTAQDAIVRARVDDSNESPTPAEHIPDWISARDFSADPVFDFTGTLIP
jgi:hypothetical protein